ncbi:MAG: TVP38/TMEM64 family protein [Myxococcales bacterium]|nr:TVP38/TMEM64 family protein [Myxococcales bacterium]
MQTELEDTASSEDVTVSSGSLAPQSVPDGTAPQIEIEESSAPSNTRRRLILLAVFILSVLAVGYFTGVFDHLTKENIQAVAESQGALGLVAFTALFTVGLMFQIPGNVFIAAAVLAYGKLYGGLASYAAMLIGVSVSFAFARKVGGRALSRVRRPIMKRMLAALDSRPILVVTGLRVLFSGSPQLNYALGLSRIRFRDYFLGSAIGLLPPMTLIILLIDAIAN